MSQLEAYLVAKAELLEAIRTGAKGDTEFARACNLYEQLGPEDIEKLKAQRKEKR